MRDPSGKARFVGESRIDHIPSGSDVDMVTSLAFYVKVHPILDKRDRITNDEWEASAKYRIVSDGGISTVTVSTQRQYWRTSMRYIVTNARPQPAKVAVRQDGLQGWGEGTRVSEESIKGVQDGANRRIWEVEVPAKGKTELTVTYLTSF